VRKDRELPLRRVEAADFVVAVAPEKRLATTVVSRVTLLASVKIHVSRETIDRLSTRRELSTVGASTAERWGTSRLTAQNLRETRLVTTAGKRDTLPATVPTREQVNKC